MELSSQSAQAGDQNESGTGTSYDAFISYHHTDGKQARKLESRLKRDIVAGKSLSVFIAPYSILPGQNFIRIIEESLARARFVLLILSPEALKADWPTAERDAAILRDPAGRLAQVIPVLVKPCKLPPLLAFRQYVDLRANSKYEIEVTKLVYTLKGLPLPKDLKVRFRTVRSGPSQAQPLIASSSSIPDTVEEQIYANLFQVKALPPKVWSAPTSFTSHGQIVEFLGRRNTPAFIVKENRVFTFSSLSGPDHAFGKVVEKAEINQEKTADWLGDVNYRRWIVELLNESIRSYCLSLRMQYDFVGRKFFFPLGVLKTESVAWTPHLRKSQRELILSQDKDGQAVLHRHRAADLRFELIRKAAYLTIDQGWVFTIDGQKPIESRRRRAILSTRFLSRQRNPTAFNETRFWAWLLSEDGRTIKVDLGGVSLEVDTKPLTVTIQGGIFGDSKELPRIIESPPDLKEPEEDEDESSIDEAVTDSVEEEGLGRTD